MSAGTCELVTATAKQGGFVDASCLSLHKVLHFARDDLLPRAWYSQTVTRTPGKRCAIAFRDPRF